ncbi:MAG: CopD family protein [Pseudomonadota bacterium]|nr:CopD family protein [Pseudomonadota bacterium]
MIALAGFLDVLLRGFGLLGLAAALGGIAFAAVVLHGGGAPRPAWDRTLGWAATGGALLAVCQALRLVLQPWALADDLGRWPLAAYLATGVARCGMIQVLLAAGLALALIRLKNHPRRAAAWLTAGLLAVALLVNGAWLVHGASRLEDRGLLMTLTVLHQLGAAVWVGGVLHLLNLRRLAGDGPLWPQSLARFSPLAAAAVALLLAAGLALAWHYVGGWGELIGTGYGAMVLTKALLLAISLGLAAGNFWAVRRWRHSGDGAAVNLRTPAFVEVELGVLAIVMLTAASLTSLPPAVDVGRQATAAEVAAVFAPRPPRLEPPPQEAFLAAATSVLDSYALPPAIEKAHNEYNHHMAGLLLLAMGLLALLEYSGRAAWARHWPLLFFGLAAFLFVKAEPTVWPLGPESFWATLQVPAVLQHRLATLLVVGLGLFEWQVRAGRLAGSRWGYVFPLLCAVGGAMLLTHSHVAFELKAEFLIEVSHAALGFLAVVMGAGRWLELRLPAPGRRRAAPGRRRAGLAWRAALVLMGLVLVFYREI